jgi:hypothetical protein
MKILGNDVYIQRGETWSLDFDVIGEEGDPYMIMKEWKNPYLAITVTSARYKQRGDFRKTYWLDLSNRFVEQADGSMVLAPIKKFISTEALYLMFFSIEEAIAYYGVDAGGKIVLDSNSDFDITNFLFFIDEGSDNKKVYKYVKSYTVDGAGNIVNEVWEEYNFRIIKQFRTNDWIEQTYLFDIKVLSGESVKEHIANILGLDSSNANNWSDTETQSYINQITDDIKRLEMQNLFDSAIPIMPDYDTKSLILMPTNLYVSANIQGRY